MASCSSTSEISEIASEESQETTQPTQATNEVEIVSVLDKLRCPASSELSRKRKIPLNPPPTGAKRSMGKTVDEPKTITASARLKEFPNEHLRVNNKNLFCSACREILSLKKSVINLHIKSVKHANGKARLASRDKREKNIADMLGKFDKEMHPVGESLPTAVRVHRVKVLTAFMKAGIPINKIDSFQDLLMEDAYRLTSSQHLRELIPVVHLEQQDNIRNSISDREISVIFDGTTHVAEATVIIVRYISDQWKICQKVARLMLVAQSMTGDEVARQLISTLSREQPIN